MDLFYSSKRTTRNTAFYAWSPLTKDAGTKVEPGQLYPIVTDARDSVKSLRKKNFSLKRIFNGFGVQPKEI